MQPWLTGLMPEATRELFELYANDPKYLHAEDYAHMCSYLRTHGRLKILNAVREIMPRHLDALNGYCVRRE